MAARTHNTLLFWNIDQVQVPVWWHIFLPYSLSYNMFMFLCKIDPEQRGVLVWILSSRYYFNFQKSVDKQQNFTLFYFNSEDIFVHADLLWISWSWDTIKILNSEQDAQTVMSTDNVLFNDYLINQSALRCYKFRVRNKPH